MNEGRNRWLRMTGALAGLRAIGQPVATGLCSACVETLSVSGVGITLMTSEGVPVSMCASDATVSGLVELEFTLGNGPAVDAQERGLPVFEVDLASRPPIRWAGYSEPAVGAGIRAVFAFPLRLGAACLGALTLYQTHPGALDDDTHADAVFASEVITRAVLTMQAGMPEEALFGELTGEGAYHAEVHQASGMISVQLGVGVADALARLRARAFALDEPIAEVAADVVARRLRFDE